MNDNDLLTVILVRKDWAIIEAALELCPIAELGDRVSVPGGDRELAKRKERVHFRIQQALNLGGYNVQTGERR